MKWVVPVVLLLACSWPSLALADAQTQVLDISFSSAALSQFLQRPMTMDATVLLPDSYYKEPERRYPVVYVVPAFDGDYELDMSQQLAWQRPMRQLNRQFIVVFLEGMVKIGGEWLHDQFADSVNDGPWATALTTEFIPETDAHFRTVPASSFRFLFGHSSGAWSALWLQVNYPGIFGGVWALSPDPVDFHDFFGPDLTRNPPQNFYRSPTGNAYGLYQENGRDLSTIQNFAITTEWMRRQLDTYDEVYSPKAPDGTPAHLFDRKTGTIDPTIAQYWEAHYDITHLLVSRWPELGPQLAGKLHVFVGTDDTFHLEGSIRLMRDALAKLGSDAQIEFAPDADHWQIYQWHNGMIRYAIAHMNYPGAPSVP